MAPRPPEAPQSGAPSTPDTPVSRVTVPGIRAARPAGQRLVVLTAYDFPTARLLDAAGIDILLVGDSVGNAVLGYDSILPVTMDEMVHHVKAVSRGARRALVVADMPYLSYQAGVEDAIRNAGRFLKEAGAAAVKVEGGRRRAGVVRALVEAEIPVMGHIGLTPQSVHLMGGYRVQGKRADEAAALVEDARALEEAGAFALVLEGMPEAAARAVTGAISIPTIGIGAGRYCDGQVLVFHDLVGLTPGRLPRFARRYADLAGVIEQAARRFADDVRAGAFPSESEIYTAPQSVERRRAGTS